MTEDPVRDGGNWFVYCRNNPFRYVDPNGAKAEEIKGFIFDQIITTKIYSIEGRILTSEGYTDLLNSRDAMIAHDKSKFFEQLGLTLEGAGVVTCFTPMGPIIGGRIIVGGFLIHWRGYMYGEHTEPQIEILDAGVFHLNNQRSFTLQKKVDTIAFYHQGVLISTENIRTFWIIFNHKATPIQITEEYYLNFLQWSEGGIQIEK